MAPAEPPAPPTAETGAYVWKPVTMLGGGFVTGIVFSPAERGLVYARTDIGGAYRLDPKISSWVPLLDHFGRKDVNYLGVESIAADPVDANRVYMAVGTYTQQWAGLGAILRSSDRGATWAVTEMSFKMGGNENGRSNGERLAIDPNAPEILFFGSRRAGLWRSADRGATWSKVERFPLAGDEQGFGLPFVVFDPKSGERGKPTKTIYVGASSVGMHLHRSDDAGATWTPVPKQPLGMMPSHAGFDSNGQLYVSYGNVPGPSGVTTGAVYKYDPKRDVWTDITPQRPTKDEKFGYGGLAVDASRPGTLLVTTIDRWNPQDEIFRTTDGGKRWTALGPKAARDPAGAAYLYWGRPTPSSTGWMGHIAIDPFDSRHAMYVTGQGIWRSSDVTEADAERPTHWSFHNQGLEETVALALVSPPAGARLVSGVGDICGFRHDDFATAPPGGMFKNPIYANVEDLDFAASAPSIFVRVGTHPHQPLPPAARGAFSTDGGTSWTPFASEPEKSGGAGSIAVSADGRTFFWVAKGAAPSFTRDRGKTWHAAEGLPAPAAAPGWARVSFRVAADRVNPSKLYLFDTRGGVAYLSHDGGVKFRPTTSELAKLPDYALGSGSIRAVPEREGHVWVTTGAGIQRSTDSGASFTPLGGVEEAHALGFGKAAPGRSYPTLYAIAKIAGVAGFFRSDDEGKTWVRINDDRHQFGGGLLILGDPRESGRVYLGTHGRGILYGDPPK